MIWCKRKMAFPVIRLVHFQFSFVFSFGYGCLRVRYGRTDDRWRRMLGLLLLWKLPSRSTAHESRIRTNFLSFSFAYSSLPFFLLSLSVSLPLSFATLITRSYTFILQGINIFPHLTSCLFFESRDPSFCQLKAACQLVSRLEYLTATTIPHSLTCYFYALGTV